MLGAAVMAQAMMTGNKSGVNNSNVTVSDGLCFRLQDNSMLLEQPTLWQMNDRAVDR